MRAPRTFLLLLTGFYGLTLFGCANTAAKSLAPPTKDTAAMKGPEVHAASKLTISADEIGKRFLKLISGLESRQDINPVRIQEIMGFPVSVAPGALGAVVWSEDLGGGWRYSFDYIPESPSLLAGVGLAFEHQTNQFSDMKEVCHLDFNYYDSALKNMGFVASPTYGPIGQLENWRYVKFAKDNSGGDIVISVIPQSVAAGSEGVCVKSITTLNGR
ncbi:hypothetical protein J7432_05300 [Xanthomonas axonopodis pv. begoniae]|nr:hypothetical protein [Xanthomonas axonopodis pv. begoniae]MBO9770113.1 hypothetical protein [Xanthomonas axonopodis pv. begoniae]PPT36737.1 hypothetical protein XabCFBP2524_10055 [Xanthomonas axonopodis pv. begoniae]